MPCSPKSLARRITSIKAFFRWLQRGGVLLNDPAVKVVQQSVMSPLPVVLTDEEVLKIIEVAPTLTARPKSRTPAPTCCWPCCWRPGSRRANA